MFPTPGPFPVLASRLQYMAYRWRITFLIGSHFSSATLHVWGYGLLFTFVTSHPSRPCKRWTAQRSLLSHVSFFLHHLSRVPWSLTARPGPGIVFSLRAPLLGRLLLGAPLPVPSSLVFLPLNTRWSVLWLVRCSKVPVGGSFSRSRLDSPVSISDSPLVGLRPFLLPMFLPKLPFFVGIAVLADASTAYANVSSYLYVTTQLALCRLMRFVFVTVSYPCQS